MAPLLRNAQIAAIIAVLLSNTTVAAKKAGESPLFDPVKASLAHSAKSDWSVCGPHGCAPVDEICGAWGCAQTKNICSSSGCGSTNDGRRATSGIGSQEQTQKGKSQAPFRIIDLAESPSQTVVAAAAQGTPIRGPVCTKTNCKLVASQPQPEEDGAIGWDICGPYGCMPFDDFMADAESDSELNTPTEQGKSEL